MSHFKLIFRYKQPAFTSKSGLKPELSISQRNLNHVSPVEISPLSKAEARKDTRK
jgi:hypothetical protein